MSLISPAQADALEDWLTHTRALRGAAPATVTAYAGDVAGFLRFMAAHKGGCRITHLSATEHGAQSARTHTCDVWRHTPSRRRHIELGTGSTAGTPAEPALDEFDSGLLTPGSNFELTFDAPGVYSLFCTLHPDMVANVTVD